MLVDHLLGELVMAIQQSSPGLIAFLRGTARRIDDVGKQHRGEHTLKIACRALTVPRDKFLDIPKGPVDVPGPERMVLSLIFDIFGIRYVRGHAQPES
jgi:hypothetical protein